MGITDDLEAERAAEAARRADAANTEPVGVTVSRDGATAEATLPPSPTADASPALADLDALLRARGLDPADWFVERITVNEWESPVRGQGPDDRPITLHQLKAHLRARRTVPQPAREVAQRHVPGPYEARDGMSRLVVLLSDPHAPYHDRRLHAALLEWLADVQPDEHVYLGDTMDLPRPSRHKTNPRWDAASQECIDAGFAWLSETIDANPDARRRKLAGNHDIRLEAYALDRAPEVATLRPASRDDQGERVSVLSVRHLLHLDALGVELVTPPEGGERWDLAELVLAPGVHVRHAPPKRDDAARMRAAIIAGHTHKQRYEPVTIYDHGRPAGRAGVYEVGTLARLEGGLGYAPWPDWQQGFATVAIDPDGSWHVDHATWCDGVLTWRGQRWKG